MNNIGQFRRADEPELCFYIVLQDGPNVDKFLYLHPDGRLYPYCGDNGYYLSRRMAEFMLNEHLKKNNKLRYLPEELFEI